MIRYFPISGRLEFFEVVTKHLLLFRIKAVLPFVLVSESDKGILIGKETKPVLKNPSASNLPLKLIRVESVRYPKKIGAGSSEGACEKIYIKLF